MSAAIVRLERFGQSLGPGRQQESNDVALQEAYLRGLTEGALNANNAALKSATQEMHTLSLQLKDNEAKRNHDFSALLELVLCPMLDVLMEHVAPLGMKQRLSQFLASELVRVSQAASSPEAVIRCPTDIAEELTAMVATTGVSNVKIEHITHGEARVEILNDEGSIVFEPAKFVNELHDLITTFQERAPK